MSFMQEESLEISGYVMSKKVGRFSEPPLATRSSLSRERVPIQVELKNTRLVQKLALARACNPEDPYTFALNYVIVEHQTDLVGKEESTIINDVTYCYTYLQTYVILGIPTERYNWFYRQAQEITGRTIECNSLATCDGYTWIVAETYSNIIGCYIHDKSLVK